MSELDLLNKQLEALRAENAKLKAANTGERPIYLKVTDKGGLSLYGCGGRWPVTLYLEQWEKLLASTDKIKAAIDTNRSKLKTLAQRVA